MEDIFIFEKLDVYQRSLEFNRKVHAFLKPLKDRSWSDQLFRAAMSISLNLAEGSGRWHSKEKRNFYFIAKGSVFECIPLTDLGVSLEILTNDQREELRNDCSSMAKMLTKLIQSLEAIS